LIYYKYPVQYSISQYGFIIESGNIDRGFLLERILIMTTRKKQEDFHLKGEELIGKVKELINEGNVRQITITGKDGKTIVVFPLTVGVLGAVISPVLAAVGAIAALVSECTISVERK
jgi:hypothetical protein